MAFSGIHLYPPQFSYELLNTRFQRDQQELQTSLRLAGAATTPLDIATALVDQAGLAVSNDPVANLVASTLKKAAAPSSNATTSAMTVHEQLLSLIRPPQSVPVAINTSAVKPRPRVFVFELKGDMRLSAAPFLTKMVTFLLSVAKPYDEVVCLLESPGGAVMDYGFGTSQLLRFRRAGIKLTVCVDRMAASGGYMLACVAHKLLAAPFSSIGSIGVKISTYNVDKLAERWGITVENFSAGKYKNLMPIIGGSGSRKRHEREKIQQALDAVLREFERHVAAYRPEVKVEEVATGEVWLGTEAKGKKLIDDIMTSEEYLQSLMPGKDVILVKAHEGGSRLLSRLSNPMFPSRRARTVAKALKVLKATITRHLASYLDVLLEDDFGGKLMAHVDSIMNPEEVGGPYDDGIDTPVSTGAGLASALARHLDLPSWEAFD